MCMLTGHVLLTVIAIRGTLSMEDLVTDFMCEPAEMDDWLGTAATSHSGHFSQAHDPSGLVGSSQGMGFFNRGDTGHGSTCHRGGESPIAAHATCVAIWAAAGASCRRTQCCGSQRSLWCHVKLHAWMTLLLHCLQERPLTCHGAIIVEAAHRHHTAKCCVSITV